MTKNLQKKEWINLKLNESDKTKTSQWLNFLDIWNDILKIYIELINSYSNTRWRLEETTNKLKTYYNIDKIQYPNNFNIQYKISIEAKSDEIYKLIESKISQYNSYIDKINLFIEKLETINKIKDIVDDKKLNDKNWYINIYSEIINFEELEKIDQIDNILEEIKKKQIEEKMKNII